MTAPRMPLHRPDAHAEAAAAHAHAASAHASAAEIPPEQAAGQARPLTSSENDTLNDDWTKVAAWDVTDAAGKPVTSLDQLAEVLGTDRTSAAGMLLDSPMASSAPPELVAEANNEVNPSDGQSSLYDEFDDVQGMNGAPDDPEAYDAETYDPATDDQSAEDAADGGADDAEEGDAPPADEEAGGPGGPTPGKVPPQFQKKALRAGAYVAVGGQRGRVEVVVTDGGKVPGVPGGLTGTKSHPAARVRLYRQAGGRWLATGQRVAAPVGELKTIQTLDGPAARAVAPRSDVSANLVLLVTQHPALPVRDGLTPGEALHEVYRRGQDSWPGERTTALDAKSWAIGRVQAFIGRAEGESIPHYTGDDDLLP